MQFVKIINERGKILINLNLVECITETSSESNPQTTIYFSGNNYSITLSMSLKEFEEKYLLLTI